MTENRYAVTNDTTVNGLSILNRTQTIDANDRVTNYFYDAWGQLVKVRENDGFDGSATAYADTEYSYSVAGNLEWVRTKEPTADGSGTLLSSVQMNYDGYGRKTSMTDPDMGSWSYGYDAAGNLTEQRDANLTRLCFFYDELNRLTHKRHDSNSNGCYTTDPQLAYYNYYTTGIGKVGKPSEIRWSGSSSQNKESFNYDSLGRLITHDRWVDSRNYEMSYASFDALHRPSSRVLTWPNGNTDTTTVTYDHEGENTMSGGGSTLVEAIGYNDMGQLKQVALGNGLTTWYGYLGYSTSGNNDVYDAIWGSYGRLWRICTAPNTSNRCTYANRTTTPLEQRLDLRYSYDPVGNVTGIRDKMNNSQVQRFGYDHLNRLTSACTLDTVETDCTSTTGNYDHTYSYDKLGNITSYDDTGYWYYDSAHKHAVTDLSFGPYSVGEFTYDDNGNMISRVEGSTTTTQNFNVENELASVVVASNTTSFAYDAAGIRTKTVAPNGVTTYYPFPGYEEEVNGSTTTRRITYSAAGQAIALRVQVVGGSNTRYYLHSDHLGSTSLATNTSGGVVTGSTARYYPFGGWRTEPTANLTDRGFTGHLHNNIGSGADDIGLIYMQARWYLPGLGRFASADTIIPNPTNPQSYNRYSYVRNSPLNFTDPTGHIEADCENNACGTTSGASQTFTSRLLNFVGDVSQAEKQFAHQAVGAISQRMAEAVSPLRRMEAKMDGTTYTPLSAEEAFLGVFGGPITVQDLNSKCPINNTCRAWVLSEPIVYIGTALIENHYLFIHEIFHVLDIAILGGVPSQALDDKQKADASFPDRPDTGATDLTWGFADGVISDWQKSYSGDPDEEYADMGMGWTYNQWERSDSGYGWSRQGQARANFMNVNMAIMLNDLLP